MLSAGARFVAKVQAETLELARAWGNDPDRYAGEPRERLERLDALCASIFRMLGAEQAQRDAEKRTPPPVRWQKRGLVGDLGSGYFADVVRGGMHVCSLRVTRHVLGRMHRHQPLAEWRAAMLEGETTISLGAFETLAAAKEAAEDRLAADLRAAAEKLGRAEGRYGRTTP